MRPSPRADSAEPSTDVMKRDWDEYLGEESSDEKDNSEEDQDYAPGRAVKKPKRRQVDRRRAKPAPKKRGRASKNPRSSTQAAPSSPAADAPSTAAATSVPNAPDKTNLKLAIPIEARLPERNIGAVEVLTFFPHHIRWPELGVRLFRNGWKSMALAKGVLHARNELSRNDLHSLTKHDNNFKQLKRSVGKAFFDDDDFTWKSPAYTHRLTAVTSYDATNYAPRQQPAPRPFTAKLVKIAKGVKNWPKGEDRGIVTQAIEFAVRHRRSDLTTADIPKLARTYGFQDPQDSLGNQWDQHALQRNEARIEITGNCPGAPKVAYAFQDEDEDTDDADDGDEGDLGEYGSENEVDSDADLGEEAFEDEESSEDGFVEDEVEEDEY